MKLKLRMIISFSIQVTGVVVQQSTTKAMQFKNSRHLKHVRKRAALVELIHRNETS